MTIIGLCGLKGSGKDTVADMLVQNDNYIKVAFADFIKNALKELFDWDDLSFEQNKKEEIDPYWGVTPRKMCQELGTEFLRVHCKDMISTKFLLPNNIEYEGSFHIKRLNKEICKYIAHNKNINIIFSDIRFQDELDYVKSLGGVIVKINRGNSNKNEFSDHISEKNIDSLQNIDYKIDNDSTIPDLVKKVNLIVEYIEEVHPLVHD
jgi:hypothetical protein